MGGNDSWVINGARYFVWNIFQRADVMVQVQIPGYPAVMAVAIGEDGEQIQMSTDVEDNQQDVMWRTTELSSLLRSARAHFYSAVPNLYVKTTFNEAGKFDRLCILAREFFSERKASNLLCDGKFGPGAFFVFWGVFVLVGWLVCWFGC